MTQHKIAVIGGGISGLAAAHRFTELGASHRVVLFERASRLGGVLTTEHRAGYQIEQSADNFITTVPWALDLCKRLGLADQLVQTNPACRQTYVVRAGRLHKLPDGFLMMAPTRIWPLVTTPVLSPWAKARAAAEYFIPPRADAGDESVASFVRRRLGRETFERLVEPLVSAVYAADLEKLSLESTLSRFREMEQEHGSLIRAMRRQMKSRRNTPAQSGARYSLFVTLRDGLTSLVDSLARRIPDPSIRLGTAVDSVRLRHDDQWELTLGDGRTETFTAVVVATPAYETARLLRPVDRKLAGLLDTIPHSGTAVISLAYDRDQIGHSLDGMGVVVPAVEGRDLLALSLSSQKYPHRAPTGKVLLRAFLGGACRPDLLQLDEAELQARAIAEVADLLQVRGRPELCTIARWPSTMPQYHVGHQSRIAAIREQMAQIPNVELAGKAYGGVGMPDCIRSGELAAQSILENLQGHLSSTSAATCSPLRAAA